MTGKERILATIDGARPDCLAYMPITMMFAADRIGVPYREYATDHRKLVEGQLRTAEEFDFDHVSAISDPAREAADYGARIEFFDDQPPAIVEDDALLKDPTTLVGLELPDPLGGGRMHDRIRGIALLKEKVGNDKFIEGWIEGPMAEAADLRGINTLMLDFFDDPEFVRDLFDLVVGGALRFATEQVAAGADIIGVGDAAASLIGPDLYEEFVWPFEKKLIDGLHAMGVRTRLHICGNTRPIAAGMGRLHCALVDLDSMCPVDHARAKMGPDQVIAGNINPVEVLRNGTPESIQAVLAACHSQAGTRYIVGAGCEVPRDTPHDNLNAMRDFARGRTT